MNATSAFPFQLYWSPQALADAVPLRVHALFERGIAPPHAGNQARIAPRPRPLRAGYLPHHAFPIRFRVG